MNEIDETQATYSQIAADYAVVRRERAGIAEQLAQFVVLLPRPGVVLDIGCGPGYDTALLAERGLTAVGLDLSLAMLCAAGNQRRYNLVQADMRNLPLSATAVGIWACASLLHLPQTAVPATLREFARVLQPGGILYLSVKQGDGDQWTATAYGHTARRYFAFWQPDTLAQQLAAAGFTIIEQFSYAWPETNWLICYAQKKQK